MKSLMAPTVENSEPPYGAAANLYVPERGYSVRSNKTVNISTLGTSDITWSEWNEIMSDMDNFFIIAADQEKIEATDLANAVLDLGSDCVERSIGQKTFSLSGKSWEETEIEVRASLENQELDDDLWFSVVVIEGLSILNDRYYIIESMKEFGSDELFSWMRNGKSFEDAVQFMSAGVDQDFADALLG